MRCYEVAYDYAGHHIKTYHSSLRKANQEKARLQKLVDEPDPDDEAVVELVYDVFAWDIPTDKVGLLGWLNRQE